MRNLGLKARQFYTEKREIAWGITVGGLAVLWWLLPTSLFLILAFFAGLLLLSMLAASR